MRRPKLVKTVKIPLKLAKNVRELLAKAGEIAKVKGRKTVSIDNAVQSLDEAIFEGEVEILEDGRD